MEVICINRISIIFRYSHTFFERRLKKYGLGFSEQWVLMYLSAHSNVNQEAITKSFMIDKGSIAKTVSKLEAKGLIERIVNPENKRENIISLSVEGKKILGAMRAVLEEWNSSVYEDISEEEIEVAQRVMEKMVKNASKLLDKEK